jgi:hypothetical protein
MTIRGHFDGHAVVLDEPASLAVGQEVRIVVDPSSAAERSQPARPSRFGFAKGMFLMSDDFNDPLDEFTEYR